MTDGRGHRERRLQGLAVSEGCSVARVCLFNEQRHSNLPLYRVDAAGHEIEQARIEQAIKLVAERLESIRIEAEHAIGAAEAGIFAAQRAILQDPALRARMAELIRENNLNAESAVSTALEEAEARMLAVDNAYIQERASDFGEIKRRLLDVFGDLRPALKCENENHCQRGHDRIVVAEELTPSLTMDLDTQSVMGFVTERGGANSHGAILARALGIPAVSGLPGIHGSVACGAELLVNGNTGEVIVWPGEESVARVGAMHPGAMRRPEPVDPVPALKVMANLRMADDAVEAVRLKAEGVGLYRTEVEAMRSRELPTEDMLFERYAQVRKTVDAGPVVYRAFDFGSDKCPPFCSAPPEENPALGWRGARWLLGNPEVFRVQARALARVSALGPVHVMYPMVVDLEQFLALRRLYREATQDLACGTVRHGLMLEVPAACWRARELLGEADFASIGTNDLIQYLFAVDRDNERVAADYHAERGVLWEIIRHLAGVAGELGKPLSVCGELAGDPRCVGRLMAAGIGTVSVSPRRIGSVRLAAAPQRGAKGTTAGEAA